MYLVSLYFDCKTEKTIQRLINRVAEKSGNSFMIEGKVPPHITIASFDSLDEAVVIRLLEEGIKKIKRGSLQWVSLGSFKSKVLYITPVLNEYLHNMSLEIYNALKKERDIVISKYYRPFQWLPHTTIGKNLREDELLLGFQELQNNFEVFHGMVVKIGLSKTKPYKEIKEWVI